MSVLDRAGMSADRTIAHRHGLRCCPARVVRDVRPMLRAMSHPAAKATARPAHMPQDTVEAREDVGLAGRSCQARNLPVIPCFTTLIPSTAAHPPLPPGRHPAGPCTRPAAPGPLHSVQARSICLRLIIYIPPLIQIPNLSPAGSPPPGTPLSCVRARRSRQPAPRAATQAAARSRPPPTPRSAGAAAAALRSWRLRLSPLSRRRRAPGLPR